MLDDKMIANLLVRLTALMVLLVDVAFGVQNVNLTLRSENIKDLIASRINIEDCNIPLDNVAFSACDRRYMPLESVERTYDRDEFYLCMGVYDVVLRVCKEKNNTNVSNSIRDVFKEMDSKTKSETYDIKSVCNSMKKIKFDVSSSDTKFWLSKLNNSLQEKCDNTCTKNKEVNPLCIFVLWGNTLHAVQKEMDVDVSARILPKKADGKTVVLQSNEKSVNETKTQPSSQLPAVSMFYHNTYVTATKPNVINDETEEATTINKENPPVEDDQNNDFPILEEQGDKPSSETKLTSVNSDTAVPLTTPATNEAILQEMDADITKVENDLKSDVSSISLPDPPANKWKIKPLRKQNFGDEIESGLASLHRKHFDNTEDSHFFAYFMAMVAICIIAYLIYHNKQKFLALILEGRRRREMRRRTIHGGYRKLDSSLEEAVTSTCSTSVTQVIY